MTRSTILFRRRFVAVQKDFDLDDEAFPTGPDSAGLTAGLKRFDEVLNGHLDREEAVVVPCLFELGRAEWRILTRP